MGPHQVPSGKVVHRRKSMEKADIRMTRYGDSILEMRIVF